MNEYLTCRMIVDLDNVRNRINHSGFYTDLDNYDYATINLVILSIIINKEKAIKDKKELTIPEDMIDEMRTLFGTNFNNRDNDPVNFYNTFRNKLAHGLFSYDEKTRELIIFNRGKEERIYIEKLVEFEKKITYRVNKVNKNGHYKQGLSSFDYTKYPIKVNDKTSFNKFLRTGKIINLEFNTTKEDVLYDGSEVIKINEYIGNNYENFFIKKESKRTLKGLIDLASSFNLSVDIDIKYIKDMNLKKFEDCYPDEKTIDLMKNPTVHQKLKTAFAADTAMKITERVTGRDLLYRMNDGIRLSLNIINKINNKENYYDLLVSNPLFYHHLDGFNTACHIANFMTRYGYIDTEKDFIEEVNLNKERIHINDLRCAELEKNESEINDKINLFNKNKIKYDNLDNGIKKKKEIYKVNINDKLLEQINKEKDKNFDLLIKMREISLKINELIIEKKRIINDNRLFDERYNYNANFIRHIRNSICHANFEIDYRYKLKDIDDYYVNFKDYDENKQLVFDASLSRDDLLNIYRYLSDITVEKEIENLKRLMKSK